MKSLSEFLESKIETVEVFEQDAASSTTTTGVANPDAKPIGTIKRDKFMGHTCYEVDDESYSNLMQGKTPFKRWSNYIKDDLTRKTVQSDFYKKKKLLVKNEKTGSMIFVK